MIGDAIHDGVNDPIVFHNVVSVVGDEFSVLVVQALQVLLQSQAPMVDAIGQLDQDAQRRNTVLVENDTTTAKTDCGR